MPRNFAVLSPKTINLTEYDFAVDKSRMVVPGAHDGSVTIRMPGKNRKTANHELIFTPYFKKYKLKFKTVAIGKSKTKKIKDSIVVFDQNALLQESAAIHQYGKANGFVNSKGHVLKMLEIFNIALPTKPNQVIKVYFKLHPIPADNNMFNYRICILSIVKTINNESLTSFPKFERKKKDPQLPPRKVNNLVYKSPKAEIII